METLNMMYIIFAIIGVVLLGISIMGGDADGDLDLDVGDSDFDISDAEVSVDSPSVFSIRTLATFLLAFGLAGIVCIQGDKGIGLQLIWGFASGLFISALYFLVMKLMYSMQGSSMTDAKSFIGREAVVSIPTTESGVGQVRVMTGNGNFEYTCREKDGKKLEQNEVVNVLSSGSGTLVVEKIVIN